VSLSLSLVSSSSRTKSTARPRVTTAYAKKTGLHAMSAPRRLKSHAICGSFDAQKVTQQFVMKGVEEPRDLWSSAERGSFDTQKEVTQVLPRWSQKARQQCLGRRSGAPFTHTHPELAPQPPRNRLRIMLRIPRCPTSLLPPHPTRPGRLCDSTIRHERQSRAQRTVYVHS
jgi:hypothetical protein